MPGDSRPSESGPKQRGGTRAWSAAMLSLATFATFAACGSGPAPETWAGQVCGALAPWRAQIAELNTHAQQQMSAASTPAQAQAGLVRLLAGGESASETARAAVVAAGTPDVDGGDEIADRFAASLSQTRDAYAHARGDLQALPTNDAEAFYDKVASVFATLDAEYTRSGVDTADLHSAELRNAFDKVDRCQ